MNIKIDSNKCQKCLTCTKVCSMGHLYENNGSPKVNNDKQCVTCLQCISSCKNKAVKCNGIPVTVIPEDKASPSIMRRSHRNYKHELVDQEMIDVLINKANTAPVMGPRDERFFTVVSDKDTIQGLRSEILKIIKKYESLFNLFRKIFFFHPRKKKNFEHLYTIFNMQYKENKIKDKLFKEAPHLLLISAPKTNSGGKDNCMYAMNSFMTIAEEYKLGTCIVGFLSGFHKKTAEYLKLPDNYIVHTGIVFGYPKINYSFAAYRNDAKVNYI
ncbi:MAG: hypothetical protein GY756_00930 [bacterium]|nr:hypothetical protein [bacterium]